MNPLDVSYGVTPDQDEFVQAAMEWHFNPRTGSPFWLERAKTLGFNPRSDVRTYSDLCLFPNVTDELRDVPVEHLIPAGFGPEPQVVSVIESGGTTGQPKRLPLLQEFADRIISSEIASFKSEGIPRSSHWLALSPSGPHGALEQTRRTARAHGAIVFAIDMDPRWVKKLVVAGKPDEAEAYAQHLVEQAAMVLRRQTVLLLRGTPPVLSRVAMRDDLVQLIRKQVKFIHWGGAGMDPDTRLLFRRELFPQAVIRGGYGTTMALGGGGRERLGLTDDDPCIFDPTLSPWVTLQVINHETGNPVEYGERGQLVVHHLSRSFLLPNNAERDSALRVAPTRDQIGDSVADISPLESFGGARVVEGVY